MGICLAPTVQRRAGETGVFADGRRERRPEGRGEKGMVGCSPEKSGGEMGTDACAVVAGGDQRQADGGDGGNGALRHDELIPGIDAGGEGWWRGRQPAAKTSMIAMRQPQCGQGWSRSCGRIVSWQVLV